MTIPPSCESLGLENQMSDQIIYMPGETVKIISGPFASLTGDIKEVNQGRQMLLVIVQMEKDHPLVKVGSGGVAVELKFQEVVRVSP